MATTYQTSAPAAKLRGYNRVAAKWGSKIERIGYAQAYEALIRDYAQDLPTSPQVLDIGCGTGPFAEAYLKACGTPKHLTLADPSSAMLAVATNRLQGRLHIKTELAVIGAPLAKHDLILCAHALDHCRDLPAALCALGQCLAPSGRMIVIHTKPHWCNWLIWFRWQHISRQPAEVLSAIKGAGLHCLDHRGFPSGAPKRTSHAYLITHATGEYAC